MDTGFKMSSKCLACLATFMERSSNGSLKVFSDFWRAQTTASWVLHSLYWGRAQEPSLCTRALGCQAKPDKSSCTEAGTVGGHFQN